ncbi:MAG TPA: hypothetical protein VLA09_04715 [Longimicrobiales bacterium]|nr:hypothetical protein [Longimicrobiales bacterium]
MDQEPKDRRLPPPVFPTGAGSNGSNNSKPPEQRPGPARGDAIREALISPEDPLPPRGEDGRPFEEGVVTGMGMDRHVEPEELAAGGDPYVMEVYEVVHKLSEALRWKGEAGLRTSPAMSRFEATLRGYCVGYLAGRRAEEAAERATLHWRIPPRNDGAGA